ncbi:MAG: hypothetical protein PHQ76_05030 [Caldisericia bacterium]|nr:MAG: Uncharacterized protein XD85_0081 [Parcubacteria bacterium 34_609]KUK99332.1 MAG: Uncharacterized protein XE08_0094 [Parcubacteria bacterium 32_520]MDD5689621.1 hypothetical protein [Caldisericia bacterium]
MVKPKINNIEEMKELLAEPKNRIKLDDFVTKQLKDFINKTSFEQFSAQDSNLQKNDFLDRLKRYEEILKDFQRILILLARWGNKEQLLILKKCFKRLAEIENGSFNSGIWAHLRWFPIQVLMYSSGIAALPVENYYALKIILMTYAFLPNYSIRNEYLPILVPTNEALSHINDNFKLIPGQERKRVPRSEYLFEFLESSLQELLFLGKDYERLFDDFEVYNALIYTDVAKRDFYPIGRFGYKYRQERENGPINRLVEEAKKRKDKWPPLQLGMFDGSLNRFLELSEGLKQRIKELSWF